MRARSRPRLWSRGRRRQAWRRSSPSAPASTPAARRWRSREQSGVFAALGVHPHQAGEDDAGRLDELRELLAHERAVAVGETGLDFFRDYAPRDRQLALFEDQLVL